MAGTSARENDPSLPVLAVSSVMRTAPPSGDPEVHRGVGVRASADGQEIVVRLDHRPLYRTTVVIHDPSAHGRCREGGQADCPRSQLIAAGDGIPDRPTVLDAHDEETASPPDPRGAALVGASRRGRGT